MKKANYLVLLFNIIPILTFSQVSVSINGADSLCIGLYAEYSVDISEYENQFLFRDTVHTASGGTGYAALQTGYDWLDIQNVFTYDLWVKPTKSITLVNESSVCTGSTDVRLANTSQNWAIVGGGLNNPYTSVGLTIGTNGVIIGEHSGNLITSRITYPVSINDWVHVAIVYQTDSIFLYLNGEQVAKRKIACTNDIRTISLGLTGYYYTSDFRGNLDEFRVWDVALTGEQIQYIKDIKLLTNVDALRYYVSFDEGEFKRTLGDLGTEYMTVNDPAISEDKYIKQGSLGLTKYEGSTIDNLSPYSLGNLNFDWSTGDVGSTIQFSPTDSMNYLSVSISNGLYDEYDSILIIGKNCCKEIVIETVYVYDTITTQVYDTLITEVQDTITTEITVYDTLVTQVFDTTYVAVMDTTFIEEFSYISVTDTLIINFIITSDGVPDLNAEIKVYPNPATKFLTVETPFSSELSSYHFRIIDSQGQQVLAQQIDSGSFQVDIGSILSNGLYFIHIVDDDGESVATKKLLIQN